MGVLGWIVVGLIAGFIVSKLIGGQRLWLDIGLGIVGAIVGASLFSFLGQEGITELFVVVAGLVVVLLLYVLLRSRRQA